jgi:ferritin-like metal-binding protein YciE
MAMSAAGTIGAASFTSDIAKQTYIAGLKNAHALEQQATQLIDRQLERYKNYPEVSQMLRQHALETERQMEQLEELLHSLGEERSVLKDLATSISGNLAAIAHSVMPDEILKNHFANHAFENFEIASYLSLIAMAEATGHAQHVPVLRQILAEEEKTATWLREHTGDITLKYMSLQRAAQKADR